MKYILIAIVALFATTGHGYEVLIPVHVAQPMLAQQPVVHQIMVYNAPYFTVTVPVLVPVQTYVTYPVQQTVYWGYPYQPVMVDVYYRNRCRLFNFNY